MWDYAGATALFTSTDNTTRSLSSDIDVEFVSSADDVLQVKAIVNVTSDINGKTLKCRNTLIEVVGSTISRNVGFNTQSNCINLGLTTPLHYASFVFKPLNYCIPGNFCEFHVSWLRHKILFRERVAMPLFLSP